MMIALAALAGGISTVSSRPAVAGTLDALVSECKPTGFRDPLPSLPHAAQAVRQKQQLRILAIGSSSTQGIGATGSNYTYPAQLMTALNTTDGFAGVDVRNAGIGGETIEQTLVRMSRELATYKPQIVIWQLGTNDAITKGTDPAVFNANIDVGLRAISASGADTILLDQQFYLKIRDTGLYDRFVNLVDQAAESHGIGLFPRYKLMKMWDATRPGGVTAMLGPDGFHMGNKGYACLGGLLADQIATAISRSEPRVAKVSDVPATRVSAPGGAEPPKAINASNR